MTEKRPIGALTQTGPIGQVSQRAVLDGRARFLKASDRRFQHRRREERLCMFT
jgi:hypothetical protein